MLPLVSFDKNSRSCQGFETIYWFSFPTDSMNKLSKSTFIDQTMFKLAWVADEFNVGLIGSVGCI